MRAIMIATGIIATVAVAACTKHDPSYTFKGQHYECAVTGGKTEFKPGEIVGLAVEALSTNPLSDSSDQEVVADIEALPKLEFDFCKGLLGVHLGMSE